MIDKDSQRARTFREETLPCLPPRWRDKFPRSMMGTAEQRAAGSACTFLSHCALTVARLAGAALTPSSQLLAEARQSRCVNTPRWEVGAWEKCRDSTGKPVLMATGVRIEHPQVSGRVLFSWRPEPQPSPPTAQTSPFPSPGRAVHCPAPSGKGCAQRNR